MVFYWTKRSHAMTPATTEDPFSHFDFDGVLGLGLQTLALSGTGWLGAGKNGGTIKGIQKWLGQKIFKDVQRAKISNPGECSFWWIFSRKPCASFGVPNVDREPSMGPTNNGLWGFGQAQNLASSARCWSRIHRWNHASLRGAHKWT